MPLVAPETLDSALFAESHSTEKWTIGRRDGWLVVRIGLARQLCGLGLDEIAHRVGLAQSSVFTISHLHQRLLASDTEYGARAASVASRALTVWGGGER